MYCVRSARAKDIVSKSFSRLHIIASQWLEAGVPLSKLGHAVPIRSRRMTCAVPTIALSDGLSHAVICWKLLLERLAGTTTFVD